MRWVLILSVLPLVGFLAAQDLFHTHDGLVHLPRIGAYFKALMDGQIPLRWAGDLNYGYGLPLFNFIYQLPYFAASLFLFFGFSLVNAFKTTITLSFLLSGIFMFLFAKAFFQDEKKALLVTLFYQFAPFRLVELLIRGSFGEVYTYTFLPLVLFGLTLLFRKITYKRFFLTALATALLILSHNSVSLLFFGVSVLFLLFFGKEKRPIVVGGIALFVGLLLSVFYWLPAILEHKYTYGDLFMKSLYLEHFSPIQNFFVPNILNSKEFQIGGVSVGIGLFHTLAIIAALVKFRYSANRRLFLFCLALATSAFFFTQPVSKPFWENISILRQFQFPWRFLSIIVFASSMLSVVFLSSSVFKRKYIYAIFLALVIASTAYYWRPQLGVDTIDEQYYRNFPLNTTYYGETDVIWSAGPAIAYPKERIEIIGGEGMVENFHKKSQFQTFDVEATTDISIVSNTLYFPGWTVYIDGQSSRFEFQDPNHRGLITFEVTQGKHSVRIFFEETKIRLVSDVISISSLAILLLLFLPMFRRRYGT